MPPKTYLFLLLLTSWAVARGEDGITLAQDIERLCFFYNSDADNCYVTDLVINLPLDFVYTTTRNLFFTTSRLNCVTSLGVPCMIHIIMTGNRKLYMQQGTNFTAK